MSKKMLAAVFAVFVQFLFVSSAFACDDEKHGHPKGKPCNLNQTQTQNQKQDQNQHQSQDQNQQVTANANSASNSASTATGGNAQSGSTSTSTTGDQNTSVHTGDVRTGDASSSSTSQGGAGGAGGNAAGGNATGGNAEGGKAKVENSGNGGGAVVNQTTTNVDNSRELTFFPVQPPSLPTTIAMGGVRLEKMGDCGRRVMVRPFERNAHVPQIFGLWQTGVRVQTMHGMLDGFDNEKPFLVDEVLIPAPFNRKIVTVYGHQVYLTVGQDGQGGSSSGAANYAADKALGVGLGLSNNSSLGVVGVVAVDCVYDVNSALKVADIELASKKPEVKVEVKPEPKVEEKIRLDVPKISVLKDTGHWVKVKERKDNPCGAAEGEKCVYVFDRVKVAEDARLTTTGEKK